MTERAGPTNPTKPPVVPFKADSALVDDVVVAVNAEPRRDDPRGGRRPDMLVMHYTGMRSGPAAVDWLGRAESRVSCHYVIDVDGRITQMVAENMRAWHAGLSSWCGETDINSCSVGIEIQNPGHEMGYHDFPAAQMEAVAVLGRDIVLRHGIVPQRVVAHSDIAPGRKIDPGEKFNWQWLFERGVGAWIAPSPVVVGHRGERIAYGAGSENGAVRAAQALLMRYGYDVPQSGMLCERTHKVVSAFQRHFRPACVDGRIDLSTLATLERLVVAYPPLMARDTPAV